MCISFLKKSDFHLSNGVFPIFCYEISATALALLEAWKILRGAWNLRGTRDTKIKVIEVSVSSLYYLFSVVPSLKFHSKRKQKIGKTPFDSKGENRFFFKNEIPMEVLFNKLL
jgi:hypothetical protein